MNLACALIVAGNLPVLLFNVLQVRGSKKRTAAMTGAAVIFASTAAGGAWTTAPGVATWPSPSMTGPRPEANDITAHPLTIAQDIRGKCGRGWWTSASGGEVLPGRGRFAGNKNMSVYNAGPVTIINGTYLGRTTNWAPPERNVDEDDLRRSCSGCRPRPTP